MKIKQRCKLPNNRLIELWYKEISQTTVKPRAVFLLLENVG